MATSVFSPSVSMSGIEEKLSSSAVTVFVTPSSNVTTAVTSAIAESRGTPKSTSSGTPCNVMDNGFLSSAEVNPPIGSMLVCWKLMYEPSGAKKQRMLVLLSSAFRLTKGLG